MNCVLNEWRLSFRVNWTLCLVAFRREVLFLFNGEWSFVKTIIRRRFTVVQFVSYFKTPQVDFQIFNSFKLLVISCRISPLFAQ